MKQIINNAEVDALVDEYYTICEDFANLKLRFAKSRGIGDELLFLHARSEVEREEKQTKNDTKRDDGAKLDTRKLNAERDALIVSVERMLFDIGWIQENEEDIYNRIQLLKATNDSDNVIESKRQETKDNMQKIEEDMDNLRREIQMISYRDSTEIQSEENISHRSKRPSLVQTLSLKLLNMSSRDLRDEQNTNNLEIQN